MFDLGPIGVTIAIEILIIKLEESIVNREKNHMIEETRIRMAST